MSESNGISDPTASSAEDTLRKFILKSLAEDQQAEAQIRADGLDLERVLSNALNLAASDASLDLPTKLVQLEEARKRRAAALSAQAAARQPVSGWRNILEDIGLGLALVGVLGIPLILILLVAKALGHLRKWPLWPYGILFICLIVGLVLFGIDTSPSQATNDEDPRLALEKSALDVERLEGELAEQVRSLIIIPAIERASSYQFAAAADDLVTLTEAAYMSARVESAGRIQTESYRRVLLNLRRSGGSTVGLAGTRGAGKSELLRSFCDQPFDQASIDSGGTIGILVAAPVVYDPASFVRLVVRRLAEKVPGYDQVPDQISRRAISGIDVVIFAVVTCCLVATWALLGVSVPRRILGWALLTLAGILLMTWLSRFYGQFLRTRRYSLSLLKRPPNPALAEEEGTRITREIRWQLGVYAAQACQRIRYVETVTSGSEVSASAAKLGVKSTAGLSLGQIPLTEPDLVSEFEMLVANLHKGGYNVVVGIDELDKLATGGKAEEFLNGVKVLFAARDCSFILTVSDNAFAQFARRGMPLRDVFDSSLDDVIWVQHMTFSESRRLSRARLGISRQSEDMSDTQILLCHCLSGGLPRDYLRYTRQLGEINSRTEGRHRLAELLPELLAEDLRSRLDGVSSALQGMAEGPVSAAFILELELLRAVDIGRGAASLRSSFLDRDAMFADLVSRRSVEDRLIDVPVSDLKSWVVASRRQLFSFLYFADTVREIFMTDAFSRATSLADDAAVGRFELLSSARRRLEVDPAAGWRSIDSARRTFGIGDRVEPEMV